MVKTILIAALLLVSAGAAFADEIYSYTGPAPADLSGSFTTVALLTPDTVGWINGGFRDVLGWDFTDGIDIWTPANSIFDGGAHINADGTFAAWSFQILSLDGNQRIAYSQTSYGAFYYQDDTPVGDSWVANESAWAKPKGVWSITGVAGSWSDPPVSTPEPSSLLLLAAGLVAILLTKQRLAGITATAPRNLA